MTRLLEAVTAHAAAEPDAIALLTEQDGTRTFREIADNATALGHAFRQTLGLSEGDGVCMLMANHPAWLEAHLAAGAEGMVPVALDPSWTDDDLVYALGHARVSAVVCDSGSVGRLIELRRALPMLRHLVAVELDGVDAPHGVPTYRELVSGAPPATSVLGVDGGVPVPKGAQIMFTSGTSAGRPKAVVTGIDARGGADYRDMFGLSANDRAIVVTPFFHNNGLGGVSVALSHGASVVFPRRFSASGFWGLVDRYRPTYLFTLSPIVNILLDREPGPWERRHTIRVGIVAAGGAANAEMIEERLGFPVLDIYGMTEAVGSGTYNRLSDVRKPGSAGRRGPGSTMTIVDADGAVAAPNQVGEVVFRRDSIVFAGYLGDDEATAAVVDGDYFHTGDLGYFDDEGFFFFVERMKDVIRRGGENIWASEVEDVLRRCDGVADVAVVGRPDPILGERVVAFVVPRHDASSSPDELRVAAASRLAPYKVPEEIVIVDVLPRTATGKVVKRVLRDRLV